MPTPTMSPQQTMPNSTFEVGETSTQVNASPLFKKRLPKTTAVRKSLWVCSRGSGNNQTIRRNQVSVNLSENVEEDNVSEQKVDNTSEEDDGEGDLDVVVDGSDDGVLGEIPVCIYDNFDPYEGPTWDDDCDNMENYLQRMYKTGELYKEKKWGEIVLHPWQVFIDKQHLRDTVRNYCIQCGFAVVVETASNRQYIVRCNEAGCPWRLHASKLIDGVTWAIKSI